MDLPAGEGCHSPRWILAHLAVVADYGFRQLGLPFECRSHGIAPMDQRRRQVLIPTASPTARNCSIKLKCSIQDSVANFKKQTPHCCQNRMPLSFSKGPRS